MSEKNGTGEFYLNDLSDCPDSYSGSDSGDESDGSDIIIRKRGSVLPLRCSDSEDDEISNIEESLTKTIQITLKMTMIYGRQKMKQ